MDIRASVQLKGNAMQTVKFGKLRAMGDPDRTEERSGIYYGDNVPGNFRLNNRRFARTVFVARTTRGAMVRKGR